MHESDENTQATDVRDIPSKPIETLGEAFLDGSFIEPVHDPADRNTLQLMLFGGEAAQIGPRVEHKKQVYIPREIDPRLPAKFTCQPNFVRMKTCHNWPWKSFSSFSDIAASRKSCGTDGAIFLRRLGDGCSSGSSVVSDPRAGIAGSKPSLWSRKVFIAARDTSDGGHHQWSRFASYRVGFNPCDRSAGTQGTSRAAAKRLAEAPDQSPAAWNLVVPLFFEGCPLHLSVSGIGD